MARSFRSLTLFLSAALAAGAVIAAAPVPSVLQFSPQGELATVRQATARFTTDMVRLGDPHVKNPFIIDCVAKGQGRWIDTRNWSYDFAQDVPLNHSCTFTLVAGSHDLTGRPLSGKSKFVFNTSPVPEAPAAAPVGQIKLDYFVPQGEAYPIRQVQTRFSEDMVRLGDTHVFNPFVVRCDAPGQGRWVDTRNWVYDFKEDLPSGVACEFRLTKGLRGISGKPVVSYPLYRFNSGGPRVVESRPYDGQSPIDENQVFLLKFDGENDLKSLPASTYCLVNDLKEKIPVRFYSVTETAAFVSKLPREYRDWWVQRGRTKEWRAAQCMRTLMPAAKVQLVFAKGLSSKAGVASSADQVLKFEVRPSFTAKFTCTRENARQACAPMTDMSLEFTDTVSGDLLKAIRLEGGGHVWQPQQPGESSGEYGEDSGAAPGEFSSGNSVIFKGPFPAETPMTLRLPANFRDETGRPLLNQARFPLALRTASYPPLAKFAANFGVIELASGAVPLTVRNLEGSGGAIGQARLFTLKLSDSDADLLAWLKRFAKHQADQNCYQCSELDKNGKRLKPDPRSFSLLAKEKTATEQVLPRTTAAKDFEVLGLPVPQSGVYLHEVESRYLGNALLDQTPGPMYVSAMSVVTNLGVHLRAGKQNALVWVTSLDKAQPVSGASLAVYSCKSGRTVWTGTTDAKGLARIDNPPDFSDSGDCLGSEYVVVARAGHDRGMVLPRWNEGIEAWRFNLPGYQNSGDLVAHTILDRTLLRAGETLHMRHVIRELALNGLSAPHKPQYKRLVIRHDGSGQEYEIPTAIGPDGNGENTWAIPKAAKLGGYTLTLETKGDRNYTLATFRVEEFRLPVLKATLQLPPGPLVLPATVPVDMQLSYLNGGGYSKAAVTLRGQVSPTVHAFEDYPDYSFGDTGSRYSDMNEEGEGDASAEGGSGVSGDPAANTLEEQQLTLDAQGGLRANSAALPKVTGISRLQMEMEYRDPSGEVQTSYADTTLWPADVVPGIRLPSWVSLDGKTPQQVDVVTVGTDGKPRANVPVTVTAELLTQQTHRRRTVGGFYSYESVSKKEKLPVQCAGRTGKDGKLSCSVLPKVSGNLVLKVESKDGAGRAQTASTSTWVSAGDRWWFDQQNDDRIDLLPEKKEYQSGDTMRLQVRMPFPEATALISIERDGAIETLVQNISSTNPVITLPVRAEYAPNVFVSALLIRGRNAAVAPTALVDLGKPAFKLGVAEIKVNWAAWRLGVKVATDQPRYHPRDKAKVSVQVTPPNGQSLPADTEVTLSAVDEALLELASNNTNDVLTPMMNERAYGMDTATSQLQVVGKRHYGRKALPPGGGGGRGANTRELFDTLIYWQARAKVDASGHAEFTVPLNDSLTGFKLVATAVSRERFGSGETRMENFQDLQLLSGLPLVVRQGDRLDPGFTVRNATDKPQTLHFTAAIDGMGTVAEKSVPVGPGAAEVVTVPFTVPKDVTELHWIVRAEGGGLSDGLKLSQKVLDPVPEHVYQATLLQLTEPTTIPVQKPKAALSGGGVQVSGEARLTDSLETMKEYFRNYPYSCLEQKTSKAVGLQDRAAWDQVMELLPAYLDDNGFAAFYPNTGGYPFLTSYILSVSKGIGWPVPENSRKRMLDALQNYAEGKTTFDDWRKYDWDDGRRRLQVLEVLAQYGRFKPQYLDTLKIDPPRWNTAMLVSWFEILRHAQGIPRQAERLAQAESILRSRLNLQGSVMTLSDGEYNWWWLYENDATTLSKLMLATMDLPAWREDEPRLLRGLIRREREGYWGTTVANIWVGFAFKRFSDTFEREPVSGTTQVTLGQQSKALAWTQAQPEPVKLDWPAGPGNLGLSQQGTGKPWITVQARARIPLAAPMSTGFVVEKKIVALQQKVAGQWSTGDVVKVCLRMQAQSDIGWVALDDPIPAGATLLGRALARDESMAKDQSCSWKAANGQVDDYDWVWPSYAEFGADGYRAYYERVYKGTWGATYTLRLNQSGDFKLPATRVEAMYAPEMFGMTPNANWVVKP